MYTLFLSKKFKKSLLKIRQHKKFNKGAFDIVVGMLLAGKKLPRKYSEHKLSGIYHGCFECHVQNDILLIYYFHKKECILYAVDIGTHSELFS